MAGSCLVPVLATCRERPNVIFIMTDQHTAGALSCAGNMDLHTPNIDRIAANGMRFINAYCTSPLSGPSRAAMFTGIYPSEVGMQKNKDVLPDSLKTRTLGDFVSSAGYECAYAGKWHVHEAAIPEGRYGFEKLHGFDDNGLAESCVSYLRRKHRKPFFMVASFDNPHNICEFAREQNLPYGNLGNIPKEEWVGLPLNFAKNPHDADLVQFEKSVNYLSYPTASYSPDDWRRYRTYYFRLVEKVDAEIGKIVDEIDRQGLWSDTIIIFTSDHGDGIGAHQWNQKSALYEEVINIPLVVTVPGKKHAGIVMPQLVSNGVDLFETICDWTDAAHPDCQGGVSFKEIVESGDPDMPHQASIVVETMFDKGTNSRGWCVRTERYKYVIYDKGRYREQLFDMSLDRGEMRNLAVEERFSDVLNEHRHILDDWMETHHVVQIRTDVRIVPHE